MKSYFLDSNVFMYASGEAHKYKNSCQLIMRFIALDEIYGVTSSEVLQEILYRYSSIGKKSIGFQIINYIMSIIHEIVPVDRKDIVLAILLMRKYHWLNTRDAIHAAVAIGNKFPYIISADKHFDKLHEIERIDPMEL